MPVGADLPGLSTCTTCTFSEDFSNYWTANMYFRARDGTLTRVPQFANQFLEGADGGMTVYYIPPYDRSSVRAFAPVSCLFLSSVPSSIASPRSLQCQSSREC